MERVCIVGSGAQARYVIDILGNDTERQVVGIADVETGRNVGILVNGIPIVCTVDALPRHCQPAETYLIMAYGNNRVRRQLASQLANLGYRFISAVSRLAHLATTADIGAGCIVNPFVAVMPNARIGAHVTLHSHVTVEHDCVIADYANLAPGVTLAGRVQVGEGAYLYTGSSIIPDVRVGAWAVVGAGATVIADVPEGATVVGVPARVIHDRTSPGGKRR